MTGRLTLLFLLLNISNGFSQRRTDTLRLFYAINESRSESHFTKIDSLLQFWNGMPLRLKILGYADFLHTNGYNAVLSQQRADNIRIYFAKKSSPGQMTFVACKGNGEKASKDNGSKEGEAFQRRVDVLIEPLIITETTTVAADSQKTSKPTGKEKRTIENLNKGESLSLEGLNFQPGRHFITKSSVAVLQKLLETLQKNPSLKIEIQGHVCCTAGDADGMDYDTHNYKLSENRAKAIYDFLVSKGIDKNRLSYKGFGHSQPKFPDEATPEEEQANRRVEILVIEK